MKYAIMSDVHANPRALKAALEGEVAWLRNRPYVHEEKDIAFVHGDFTRPQSWNYILSTEAAVQNFFSREERLLFCGHTHHAAVWEQTGKGEFRSKFAKRFRTPAVKGERVSFKLKEGSRYIVNVGSVGYPRNDLCASYAIYDTAKNLVMLRRLPFDFKNCIADMIENKVNLPDWLVALLTVATRKSEHV